VTWRLTLIEDRYDHAATIISTQIPVAKWFDIIGDPTLADAICDRIVPPAMRINLTGKSMRAIKKVFRFRSLDPWLPPRYSPTCGLCGTVRVGLGPLAEIRSRLYRFLRAGADRQRQWTVVGQSHRRKRL